MDRHRINIEDLPDSEDKEASSTYEATLCTDGGFKPPEFLWNATPSVDGLLGGEDIELKLEAVEVGNRDATALELVRFKSIKLVTPVWLITPRIGQYRTRVTNTYDPPRRTAAF
jgi:hypothetical protein